MPFRVFPPSRTSGSPRHRYSDENETRPTILIDKYYSGFVWGDTNHAVNFDEAGLAGAIYSDLQADTTEVYKTFWRLNEYHTVDADDVAEIYVDKLRGRNATPPTLRAVAADSRLKNLLIKVLDEGWTTDNEYACIDFLKELK